MASFRPPSSQPPSPGLTLALITAAAVTTLATLAIYTQHYTHSRSVRQPPFRASNHTQDSKRHLLLCASGSVAAIKLPLIAAALSRHADKLSVRIVLTEAAKRFLAGQAVEQPRWESLRELEGVEGVYGDADEWAQGGGGERVREGGPWSRGGPVLHVELRKWADACVVAPCSADVMGKVVAGVADGLLTSVLRAWDVRGVDAGGRGVRGGDAGRCTRPVVLVPAMNTAMWVHPVTERQLGVLEGEWKGWVRVLRPVEKTLVCGDQGTGAMKEWSEVVKDIEEMFGLKSHDGQGWVDAGEVEGKGV